MHRGGRNARFEELHEELDQVGRLPVSSQAILLPVPQVKLANKQPIESGKGRTLQSVWSSARFIETNWASVGVLAHLGVGSFVAGGMARVDCEKFEMAQVGAELGSVGAREEDEAGAPGQNTRTRCRPASFSTVFFLLFFERHLQGHLLRLFELLTGHPAWLCKVSWDSGRPRAFSIVPRDIKKCTQ